jgi:F-type H+-transporting ATPase subunit b
MFDEKFYLALAFLTFLGLIVKFVWPKIANALDENSKKIAKELLEAKELKERAQKLLKDAEKFYQDSVLYAEKMARDAESEAKQITEIAKNDVALEIQKKTDAAIARVKLEEERLVRELKLKIVENAIAEISQNLDFDADEQGKLLTKSIKNLETLQ